jgi:ech hydrogenase subunit C
MGNPKHADVLLGTGPANYPNYRVLRNLYEQMPDPKGVIVVGTCGCTSSVFHNYPNIIGGIDKVIPVDVYVPGCAARPEAITGGVVLALKNSLGAERW